MQRIYLDNGATSYPKAPLVGDAVKHFIENVGSNVNRSGYALTQTAEEIVFATREEIGHLFNFAQSENVIFTLNVTYALNFLVQGILQPETTALYPPWNTMP